MPIYKLQLRMTAGGRTANEIFENEMLYRLDGDLVDPRHRLIANNVGDAFCNILIRQVRVLNALITESPTRKYVPRVRGRYVRVALTGSGEHGPTDVLKLPAPLTYCAAFDKDAALGDPGHFDIRGCFYDDETITSPDLNITTVPAYNGAHLAGWGATLLAAFTAADAQMILRAPGDLDPEEFFRPVIGIPYTGLSQHQLYNKGKSITQKEDSLFISAVKALIKFVRGLIKKFGTLGLPAQALAEIANKVLELVGKFGIERVLGYDYPDDVQGTIIPALPAHA